MSSLHSMPPPVMLQQGQQGSHAPFLSFLIQKQKQAIVTNLVRVTLSIGYMTIIFVYKEGLHFCPLHLYEPLYLTRINGPFLE